MLTDNKKKNGLVKTKIRLKIQLITSKQNLTQKWHIQFSKRSSVNCLSLYVLRKNWQVEGKQNNEKYKKNGCWEENKMRLNEKYVEKYKTEPTQHSVCKFTMTDQWTSWLVCGHDDIYEKLVSISIQTKTNKQTKIWQAINIKWQFFLLSVCIFDVCSMVCVCHETTKRSLKCPKLRDGER